MSSDAARLEAEGATDLTIEWRGTTFSFPANELDWPIDAMEAFEDGRALRFLRHMLGTADWQRLKALAPTMRVLNEFLDLVAKAKGFDSAGE